MKSILIIILILLLVSCKDVSNKVIVDKKTGRSMLVGITDRTAFNLPDFSDWFNGEYAIYEPDDYIVQQINMLSDSINIDIYMGTWCSDSRREVPRFLKIMDLAGFDSHKLKIINVDRDKISPTHEEKGRNIEYVPTFIIHKNNLEIGRIIEFPIITLEGDLINILMGIEE